MQTFHLEQWEAFRKGKERKGLSEQFCQFSFELDFMAYRPEVASTNSLSTSSPIERLCSVNFAVLRESFHIYIFIWTTVHKTVA